MTTIKLQRLMDDEGSGVSFDATLRNRDPSQTSGFSIFPDVKFGNIVPTNSTLEKAGFPGGRVVNRTEPISAMQFRLYMVAPTYDTAMSNVRALADALSIPGVWIWQPDGASEPRYIDMVESPIPSPLMGRALDLHWLVNKLKSPEGIPVDLWHSPWLRGPKVTAVSTVTISDQVHGADVPVTNLGNRPALARLTLTPQTGSLPLVLTRMGVRSKGNLNEFATLYDWEAEAFDSADATVTTPSNEPTFSGTGNNFVRISYGSAINQHVWRFTKVITPTDKTALVGTFRLFVYVRPSVGAIHTMAVHTGLSNDGGAAPFVNDTQTIDTTGMTTAATFEVDLGLVTYDSIGAALLTEFWSGVDTAAATLDVDMFKLIPADEQYVELFETGLRTDTSTSSWPVTTFVAPTHLNRPSHKQVGDPGYTVEDDGAGVWSGVLSGDHAVFGNGAVVGGGQQHPNRTDEAVGVLPNTGIKLAAGRYTLTFNIRYQENANDHVLVGEGRVRNITTLHDVAKVGLWSVTGAPNGQPPLNTLSFQADGTSFYQPQVVFVADRDPAPTGPARRKLSAFQIDYTFIRTVDIGSGQSQVLDGKNEKCYAQLGGLGVSGNLGVATHMLRALQFLEIPKGDALVVFDMGSIPQPGMDNILDDRGNPYPCIDARGTYLASLELWPRYAPF